MCLCLYECTHKLPVHVCLCKMQSKLLNQVAVAAPTGGCSISFLHQAAVNQNYFYIIHKVACDPNAFCSHTHTFLCTQTRITPHDMPHFFEQQTQNPKTPVSRRNVPKAIRYPEPSSCGSICFPRNMAAMAAMGQLTIFGGEKPPCLKDPWPTWPTHRVSVLAAPSSSAEAASATEAENRP